MQIETRILLDDNGLIVVDKPAGVSSTGRTLTDPDCIQSLLMRHYRRTRIWAVHQLDKETSGLNLFVKRKALVAHWAKALRDGEKIYYAYVHGRLGDDSVLVNAPLGYCARRKRHAVISAGKQAISHIVCLKKFERATKVAVRIDTGRTHQVRLHLEHLGHPVLGDSRYGCEASAKAHNRTALHAQKLTFDGGLSLISDEPEDLLDLESRLR